jgi:hypothetical protein
MIYYHLSLGRHDVSLNVNFDRSQFDDHSNIIDVESVLGVLDLELDVIDDVSIENNINAGDFLKLLKKRYDIREMSIGYCTNFTDSKGFSVNKLPRLEMKSLIDKLDDGLLVKDKINERIDALIADAKCTEEVFIAFHFLKDNNIVDSDSYLLLDKMIDRYYENEMHG